MPNCFVEQPGELADGHPVAHRYRKLSDEGLVAADEHRPFDAVPPIGFGRSQTMTVTPCCGAARRQLAIV